MRDFFRRFGVSLLISVMVMPVTYVGQHALQAWGVLDPVARSVGAFLQIHVAPVQAEWTVTLIVTLIGYVILLWVVWRHFRSPHARLDPTEQTAANAKPIPLQLAVAEDGPFFETGRGSSFYTTRRTLKIRVRNASAEQSLTDCKVQILDIEPKEFAGPWVLKDGFSLAPGDQVFVPFVIYGEAIEYDKNPGYCDSFMEVLTTHNAPLPSADVKNIFSFRATAHGSAFCDLRCQVWVEQGRLRVAPFVAKPSADGPVKASVGWPLPDTYYAGLWRYKLLARLPLIGEKARQRLAWLDSWEKYRAEVHLSEAATRAYEYTRTLPAGEHAEALAKTDQDIITWYCNAMTMPINGRPPMVTVKGVRPPSRLIEPVDADTLNRFDYVFAENKELILKERSGRGQIRTLMVNAREFEAAIAQISTWGGITAAHM